MADETLHPVEDLRQALLAQLGEDAGHLYPVELEKQFPRILQRIVELWRSPALDHYFEELMTTSRYDRQGFPEPVALELLRLSSLHASYRLSATGAASPWDVVLDPELFKKPD